MFDMPIYARFSNQQWGRDAGSACRSASAAHFMLHRILLNHNPSPSPADWPQAYLWVCMLSTPGLSPLYSPLAIPSCPDEVSQSDAVGGAAILARPVGVRQHGVCGCAGCNGCIAQPVSPDGQWGCPHEGPVGLAAGAALKRGLLHAW